ncbi:17-beta-hydroxysteroid dehydrogenase type 6 [Monodon monoceros]|uniref:17-beta-hydroxysteroid dehydrogenase type 6 n=2 Tax=Monodontidae TaxID=9747 RepID=A0A2Y9N010_DELLE|nr:17-beta-hydroxysteroid dehydrogenase type 6 [Delphinapterus leucas]XP_022427507.1 17-beta-hydroxysteroid dehydrogenase type 6 [Delphinapterus leucas]XP_029060720.1 17-beta-hydroxysteroid dehydrogenase type 6 [Monodon monoceros]
MWLYLAVLVGLYYLLRWYQERQVVSHLQDKFVFITGCDSGFGNLLARQLHLRGLRVLAACLTEQGAEQLRNQTSDRLETVILDVTKTESITAATEWVKERVGNRGLWGLVNNAGIFHPHGYTEWLKIEAYMDTLKVNLIGLIEVTLSMLPLVRRAQGRIVNVSSILGRIAFFGGVYSSTKYGVEAFSDILRRELQHFGVKISIIEPGYFRTGMSDLQKSSEAAKQVWKEVPVHIKESYGQKFFDTYHDLLKQGMLSCSTNLNLVTDCMEHALTSVHPRTRYSAGWDAKFFFIPLSYLPTSLADYILTRSWPKPAQAV